ncbi:hypothetical protein R5R35_011685 [Gryllus longicercus]|uniref:GP-PDE domain-containing protein n=1 Tax=Gryllus longicercus TaxID=2509291 RepID=A0AAN9Z6F4_9ORTH
MAALVVEILYSCFIGWFYFYGLWLYTSEMIFYSVSLTAIGTIVLFIAVNFLRIPSPDQWKVVEVLGIDPRTQEDQINEENDSKEQYVMKVVAHRAAPLDAPENSLAAIRKSKEKGCTAVELDVCLTADDIPIIFHDDHIDRLTERTGQINEMTWAELKDLDISAKHPFRDKYPGEKILLFEDAINECIKLDLRIFIDIKADDWKTAVQLSQVILEAFKRESVLYGRAVITSFNPVVVFMIRRADPQIVCALAWRPKFFSIATYSGNVSEGRPRFKRFHTHLAARVADAIHEWIYHNILFYVLGLSAVLVHKDCITLEYVNLWSKRGVRVIPWSINLPAEKQFFSKILKVTYLTDTLDVRAV